MTTTISTIESVRNESFKSMDFNEVEAALNNHVVNSPALANYYTSGQVAELEKSALVGNQLLIEYSLHTNDLKTAAEAARDVLELQ